MRRVQVPPPRHHTSDAPNEANVVELSMNEIKKPESEMSIIIVVVVVITIVKCDTQSTTTNERTPLTNTASCLELELSAAERSPLHPNASVALV